MATKYMKSCSKLAVIRTPQIKATTRCHFTLMKVPRIRKLMNVSVSEGVES